MNLHTLKQFLDKLIFDEILKDLENTHEQKIRRLKTIVKSPNSSKEEWKEANDYILDTYTGYKKLIGKSELEIQEIEEKFLASCLPTKPTFEELDLNEYNKLNKTNQKYYRINKGNYKIELQQYKDFNFKIKEKSILRAKFKYMLIKDFENNKSLLHKHFVNSNQKSLSYLSNLIFLAKNDKDLEYAEKIVFPTLEYNEIQWDEKKEWEPIK